MGVGKQGIMFNDMQKIINALKRETRRNEGHYFNIEVKYEINQLKNKASVTKHLYHLTFDQKIKRVEKIVMKITIDAQGVFKRE